ncbi:MAG: 3-phosphoglycerate dehydrogenase [Cryomorphaceae bacterium]|nr:MAG: 3-phosphoglycerate dehydrogenase [Cryomorphaceae bacterium]
MNILANDGISKSGIDALKKSGFNIITTNVAQEQLENYINKENISVILVRSATTVRKDLIDKCPNLKIIGRGGVGMDNIDVDYARSKNIHVINTPAASSASVAELVFAHLYSGVRFLHESNRAMPLEGDSNFKKLKKAYAKGVELRGKTIGIIGFGRIGRETAKIGLGVGMNVIAYDKFLESAVIKLDFMDNKSIDFNIKISKFDDLLKNSDFISLHVPAQKNYVIGKNEFDKMKDGVGIINAARGGVINEVELVSAIENGKVSFAGLDTFENEPKPEIQLLMNSKLSLTPHIGAATNEAQDRIGLELAEQITNLLK